MQVSRRWVKCNILRTEGRAPPSRAGTCAPGMRAASAGDAQRSRAGNHRAAAAAPASTRSASAPSSPRPCAARCRRAVTPHGSASHANAPLHVDLLGLGTRFCCKHTVSVNGLLQAKQCTACLGSQASLFHHHRQGSVRGVQEGGRTSFCFQCRCMLARCAPAAAPRCRHWSRLHPPDQPARAFAQQALRGPRPLAWFSGLRGGSLR